MGHLTGNSRVSLKYFVNDCGHCSFHRAVSKYTYANLLKHIAFTAPLLIEDYGKCAVQKEAVIAPFVEQFKTATSRKFD